MISQISLFHLFESFRGKRVCKELEGEQLTQGIVSNDSSVSPTTSYLLFEKKKKKKSRKEGAEAYIAQMMLYPTDSWITLCLCV